MLRRGCLISSLLWSVIIPLSIFVQIENLVNIRIVSHQTVLYRINRLCQDLFLRKFWDFYITFLIIFYTIICQSQNRNQNPNPLNHPFTLSCCSSRHHTLFIGNRPSATLEDFWIFSKCLWDKDLRQGRPAALALSALGTRVCD